MSSPPIKLSSTHITEIISKVMISNNSNHNPITYEHCESNIIAFEELISSMTMNDIVTIATENATSLAVKFEERFRESYNKSNTKLPCFWSGKKGREMAKKSEQYINDDDLFSTRVLFEYCSKIRTIIGKHDDFMTELSFAISRCFVNLIALINVPSTSSSSSSTKSGKDINIFIGTDKATESTGFHVGNNFWNAELPTLQTLLSMGYVDNLILHVLDYDGNYQHILNLRTDNINLPLWKRNWHPLDPVATKKSFVDDILHQEDWEKWRVEPPRNFITYSRMKKIFRFWLYKVHEEKKK